AVPPFRGLSVRVAVRIPLPASVLVKLIGCEPATVASAAEAAASGPLTPPTAGGVLSSRLRVMSVSAGTAIESAKSHVDELRSVLQFTYASKSRAPWGSVQFSLAV